jgi:nucleoside-diphosphate-sugar epimerase
MTYGPGQALAELVPSVTLALLRGERPKVSSGTVGADWMYTADVVEGFIAAATAPGIEGEAIDLGTGTLVPIRKVVERIAAHRRRRYRAGFRYLARSAPRKTAAANTADAVEWYRRTTTRAVEPRLCRTSP